MAPRKPTQIEKKQTSQFVEEIVDYEEPETCNIWDKIEIANEREEEKAKWNRFRKEVIDGLLEQRNKIEKKMKEEILLEQVDPFQNIELSISSI